MKYIKILLITGILSLVSCKQNTESNLKQFGLFDYGEPYKKITHKLVLCKEDPNPIIMQAHKGIFEDSLPIVEIKYLIFSEDYYLEVSPEEYSNQKIGKFVISDEWRPAKEISNKLRTIIYTFSQ